MKKNIYVIIGFFLWGFYVKLYIEISRNGDLRIVISFISFYF